jgi:chorismate mutase
MNIEECRKRIDQVDEQLVRLLNVRAQLAIEIGRAKRDAGIAILDHAREEEVARRVVESNPGVLDSTALLRLFREIVAESRRASEQATARKSDSPGSRVQS